MSAKTKQLCLENSQVIVEDEAFRVLDRKYWEMYLACTKSPEEKCKENFQPNKIIRTGWEEDENLLQHRKKIDQGCAKLGGITCGGHDQARSIRYPRNKPRATRLGEYPYCFSTDCIDLGAEGVLLQMQAWELFFSTTKVPLDKVEYDAVCSDKSHLISNGTHLLSPLPNVPDVPDEEVEGPQELDERLSPSSTLSLGAIVGIVAGVLVAVGIFAIFILRRRKAKQDTHFEHLDTPLPDPPLAQTKGSCYPTCGLTSTSSFHESGLQTYDIDPEKITVKRVIGRGAFGAVYSGEYLGSSVALKTLMLENEEIGDFTSEINILKHLHHPNIVQLIGITNLPDYGLCTVMEFMGNKDLRYLLQQACLQKICLEWGKRQTYPSKKELALDISRGIAYLHGITPPIIHRDLKSANVLLNEHCKAKIADFGVSRTMGDTTHMTSTGTPYWCAPEVLREEVYDESADIYSFGVILSELDTEQMPYANEFVSLDDGSRVRLNQHAISLKVCQGLLRPSVTGNCPQSIRELALKCVAFNPKDRPSAIEITTRLSGMTL